MCIPKYQRIREHSDWIDYENGKSEQFKTCKILLNSLKTYFVLMVNFQVSLIITEMYTKPLVVNNHILN